MWQKILNAFNAFVGSIRIKKRTSGSGQQPIFQEQKENIQNINTSVKVVEQEIIEILNIPWPTRIQEISGDYRQKGRLWKWHFDESKKLWKPGQIKGLGEHKGYDIPCPLGAKIFSVVSGNIDTFGDDPEGFGRYIKQIWNGRRVYYAHLGSFNVRKGQFIKAGKLIGYSGNSGISTNPHLHIEFRYGDGFDRQSFPVKFV